MCVGGRRDKQGRVPRQHKDMFKRGTRRLSAVQGQEGSPGHVGFSLAGGGGGVNRAPKNYGGGVSGKGLN